MTSLKIGSTACLAAAALGLLVRPLPAQERRVEQVYTADGKRLDFPPDGVWRVKARQVAEQRARLLSQGRYGTLNAPQANLAGGVLQGTLSFPSFLVAFNNTDTSLLPKAIKYDSIFYSTTPLFGRAYTVRTYYEEMSNNVFHVAGQSYNWVKGDTTSTYYLSPPNCPSDPLSCPQGLQRLRELLVKPLVQYDATVDFGQYDNDGPDGIPNSGDDDGFVDLVQFVQPVRGAECSGSGYNAHHYSLQALGGAYTTNDARTGGGSIRVNSYQIVAGVGGTSCFSDTAIMAIGTSVHELGHGLGLPDLYDTSPTNPPPTEGIGEWGTMGSGNYTSLNSPAHFDAWSLQQVGWVTLVPLTTAATVRVGAVEISDTVFVVRPLVSNPRNEYFLLENKQAQKADTSNMNTGGAAGPKLGGLLVWHVDSTKIAQNMASNTINTGSIHGLELVQADSLRQLDKPTGSGGNRGDAGDPYPGSKTKRRFSYDTNPRAVMNSDTTVFVGFQLDSITQVTPQGQMVFKIAFGGPTLVRATDTTAQVSVDGTRYRRFAQLLTPGSVHTVAIDSAQVSADSLRQYVFESWSNGKARSDTVTAKLAGDTIIATVSLRLRVRATASGAGTVTAYPAGNAAAGVYVRKDSTFSLKATPNSGKIFLGWSGDSTTSADSIRLTVSKPYTLVASFGDPLAGSAGTPPGPVMGKAYSHTLSATGGTGTYNWQIVNGALPDGLTLSTAGAISGIPSKSGSFNATARVTSGSQTADVTVSLTVTAPLLAIPDVVSQILGTRSPLTADQLKYLDLLGNNNGGFDVGDFLAWVDVTTSLQAPEVAAALARLAPAKGVRP